jgi:hypothetical protein
MLRWVVTSIRCMQHANDLTAGQCATPEKVNIRAIRSSASAASIFSNAAPCTPSSTAIPASTSTPSPTLASTSTYTSSRYDRPPLTAPPTSTPTSFPRFGSMSACPGCHRSVSPMERGVVPGPQGSRWHAACLVCGGKREVVKGWGIGRGREERRKGEPGCGKKLDSAAKGDGEGGVWCRECLVSRSIDWSRCEWLTTFYSISCCCP